MIIVRDATIDDVEMIRDVFHSEYKNQYAYPLYFDLEGLARLVYAEGSILLVAVDTDLNRVVGTASVVFSVGAYNDLVGEFGRLVVHSDFRGLGIGKKLMQARLDHVQKRLHIGIVENRVTHSKSQKISERFGFVPVGFSPMRMLVKRRESIAVFVQYFNDALSLRRNNPRVIPEASELAKFALGNCGLPEDVIIDDSSPSYPNIEDYELEEMKTEGYTSLLRIERGRIEQREIFGPVRLHYGLFQLKARHSHYLLARKEGQIVGGIGFMIDEVEKAVRVFELISVGDAPIRFLLQTLVDTCVDNHSVEHIAIDVSAYAPRMQRTLLELGFIPDTYIPANVFHQVERLDVIRMSRILVPFDIGEFQICDSVKPIAQSIINSFALNNASPCVEPILQNALIFEGLNKEQIQQFLSVSIEKSFEESQVIFRKGQDDDDSLYLILSGKVDLVEDDERHIARLGKGESFGEGNLLHSIGTNLKHSLSAIAKNRVNAVAFPKAASLQLFRKRPDIGVVIYRNLGAEIREKLNRYDDH